MVDSQKKPYTRFEKKLKLEISILRHQLNQLRQQNISEIEQNQKLLLTERKSHLFEW